MEGTSKPHAVMLPIPMIGHINPMLHFSSLLAANGFTITFVNTEFNRGLTTMPNPGWDIRYVCIPDGLPPHHGRTTNVPELLASVHAHMGAHFEKLMGTLMLQQPPVSCIVANAFFDFAQPTAKKLGLPYASFWPQSAASYASISMFAQGFKLPKEPSTLVTGIPGVPALEQDEIITFLRDPRCFLFERMIRAFETARGSDWVIMNTFEELEGETVEAVRKLKGHPPVLAVGPLLPSSFFLQEGAFAEDARDEDRCMTWLDARDEERCMTWLDAQGPRSVLYVSFGSITTLGAEQMREIALGLEGSGRAFLWVVRHCEGAQEASAAALPEGFLDRTKARGLIVSWAPQLRVLSHRAVGGFLTHCGWNSTLEALSAGVPLLGWWSVADQAMNCKLVEAKWKAGLRLERSSVATSGVPRGVGANDRLVLGAEVQRKVAQLMGASTTQVRDMASHWKHATRRAMALPFGSSLQNIHRFARAIDARKQSMRN